MERAVILICSSALAENLFVSGAMQSSEMPGPEFHDFSYVGKFFSNFGRQILEKGDEWK